MATRRRPRAAAFYQRPGPIREPYDLVLIVCEGLKTEPNYFNRLCAVYGLSSANVRIAPRGNDPLSLVDFAISELEADDELNRAYCVFDRDGHGGALIRLYETFGSHLHHHAEGVPDGFMENFFQIAEAAVAACG